MQIPFLLQSIQDVPTLVDTLIPCLFFMDDLVLLSKSQEELQKLRDKTEEEFVKRELKVNIEKTRLLVFNKKLGKNVNRSQ